MLVEPDQPAPRVRIREGELRRVIDPARALGQSRLEQVGAVGGEQERDVGVLAEPVHLVQQLEQQRVLAGAAVPLLGDQVHVLDHHHRGLQRPCDRAGRGDLPERRAGQHHHGDARQLAQQVADGVGLAGARRAVQQDTALEVLAARAQPRHVPGHPDDLPLDPLEQVRRQDHLLAADLRTPQETQQLLAARAEDLAAEADHVPAEHVPLDAQPPYFVDDLPCPLAVRARRLHADLRAGGLDQQGQRALPVRDQAQGTLQARQGGAVRSDGQQVSGRAAHAHVTPLLVLNQIRQTGSRVEPGNADQLGAPTRPRQPGVQADLDVHPVIARPRGPDHRHVGRLRTQVLPQRPLNRRILGPCRRHRTAQQPPGQPSDVSRLQAGLQVGRAHRRRISAIPGTITPPASCPRA